MKKGIGNLFVRLFVISLLTFRYFSTIVSLFGAGAAPFFTAPAPAPAPSKPFRRLRLRLRLRPKCVGSGGSGSGSGSGSASLVMLDIPGTLLHHFPIERSSEVRLWSHRVAVRFLPITFDLNVLDTWGWYQSVCLVNAHRLTCNMTYLGHTVTLTWGDLRSNFKIDLSRIKNMDRSGLTRGIRWCQNYSCSL